MLSFSDNLRRLREDAHLTQAQLANNTGLKRSSINNYENDLRRPDFETLEILADYFNVDMNLLLRGSSPYSETEETLIDFFRDLNEEGQHKLLDYALDLINGGRYSKKDSAAGVS